MPITKDGTLLRNVAGRLVKNNDQVIVIHNEVHNCAMEFPPDHPDDDPDDWKLNCTCCNKTHIIPNGLGVMSGFSAARCV